MTYRMLLTDGKQVVRSADYIGSFLVAGKGHHDRAEVVRQKLEAAQAYTHSKPILLFISLNGIKVCREKSEHVYMAHALRRISYATCDPENLQFAFLAREPKAQSNVQYCHAFVTANAAQAEELNNIVGEAFRLAYAEQQHQQAKVTCSPTKPTVNNTHPEPTCDVLPTGPGLPVQAPAASIPSNSIVSRSSSSQLLLPQQTGVLVDQVIHKPLPPVPVEATSHETDGRCGDSAELGEAAGVSSPAAPPSSPVAEVAGKPSAGERRRLHKHHKHHRHRHRQRVCDNPEHTDNQSVGIQVSKGDCPVDSRVESLPDTAAGAPPGGKSPALQSHSLCEPVGRPPADDRSVSPPLPPPRGLSQVCSPSNRATAGGHGHFKILLNGDEQADCSKELVAISSGMQEKCRLETDISKSRPLSDVFSARYSPHFYDMADHQSCGAVAAAAQAPGEQQRRLSQPLLPSLASHPITAAGLAAPTTLTDPGTVATTMTATMATSSSFSDGSAGSLPAMSFSPRSVMNQQPAGSVSCSLHPGIPNLSPPTVLARDTVELANAVWYQPSLPRNTVVEMLLSQPSGSFVIRDSASHSNCYALSVRFGNDSSRPLADMCHRLSSAASSAVSTPHHLSNATVYPQVAGISHFLIERTVRGGVRLKGLEKEWPTLPCLVLHLTVMPEMLPCPLRMPTPSSGVSATALANGGGGVNPAFRPNDHQPAGVHFRPIDGAEPGRVQVAGSRDGHSTADVVGEDYQCLSDFSSIMADLQPRTRLAKPKGQQVVARN